MAGRKETKDTTASAPWLQRLYEHTASHPRYDAFFVTALLLGEAVLCVVIIQQVSYTEIDWRAYMEEVESFLGGQRDYLKIRGGTGPLVYPAGFLYLFSFLRWLTNDGTDVRRAQYIFAGFYLGTQATVLRIYQYTVDAVRQEQQQESTAILRRAHEVWSWRLAMVCLCCSKRVHSIFVLRLFNDGPTMLLLYLSVCLFASPRLPKWKWSAGCFLFSLAVSLKMNVLLFAPGLLLLLLQISSNWIEVLYRLLVFCALPQLVLGAPFLLTYPVNYLRKAFELDRIFFYKWTVNWKFLPEDKFVSKQLSMLLLGLHIGCLVLFCSRWLQATKAATGKRIFLFSTSTPQNRELSPIYITLTMLASNYIGICFARTLHYQFYSWYFHALPFLLWCGTTSSTTKAFVDPVVLRIILLVAVESSFLTFPATPTSSAVLQMTHVAILLQIRPPDVLAPAAATVEPLKGEKKRSLMQKGD